MQLPPSFRSVEWGETSRMRWDQSAMMARLVRYGDLVACRNAFIDTRSPGSERKENFCIIGPGVAENPGQHVHLRERHGFNIGGARQPEGCLNSQHSHLTAEVFVVHTGHWRIHFGPERNDGHLDVGPGDVASLPPRMFRGFSKLDPGAGFLWVALGGDDPGHVTWAPAVFDLARDHGLVLLKGGRLIDTTLGETVPPGAEREDPPGPDEVSALATPPAAALARIALRASEMRPNPASPLAGPGVEECGIIAGEATGDGFPPGPIAAWWRHGFNLRLLRLAQEAATPFCRRDEAEVLFVHSGAARLEWPDGAIELGCGDTMSVPSGLARRVAGAGEGAEIFVVRGGENPAMPRLVHPVPA
jgi:mannose-6-phosphate isomerase-like protein (cupin superfamily)